MGRAAVCEIWSEFVSYSIEKEAGRRECVELGTGEKTGDHRHHSLQSSSRFLSSHSALNVSTSAQDWWESRVLGPSPCGRESKHIDPWKDTSAGNRRNLREHLGHHSP